MIKEQKPPQYKTKEQWLELYNEYWTAVYESHGILYKTLKLSTFKQYIWEGVSSAPRTEFIYNDINSENKGAVIDYNLYKPKEFVPRSFKNRFRGTLGEGEDPEHTYQVRRDFILDMLRTQGSKPASYIARKMALYQPYSPSVFRVYLETKLLPFMVAKGYIKNIIQHGTVKYKFIQ